MAVRGVAKADRADHGDDEHHAGDHQDRASTEKMRR
jgi:hypothetical protein